MRLFYDSSELEIKSDREENQYNMTVSLIDNIRLSLRWADKEHPEVDTIINLTMIETEKIKNMFTEDSYY